MSGVHRIPSWVWSTTAALLIVAIFELPYGYYMLLRIVVCAFAAAVFALAWDSDASKRPWPLIFAGIAILFNPLVPFHLDRATWFYVDIGTAILIAAHLMTVRARPQRPEQ